MDLHEMLVVPGFHAVTLKLADYFVGEGLVARGTSLVAVAGKISGEKRIKKKKDQ